MMIKKIDHTNVFLSFVISTFHFLQTNQNMFVEMEDEETNYEVRGSHRLSRRLNNNNNNNKL